MKSKFKTTFLYFVILLSVVFLYESCSINKGYAVNITVASGAIPPELPKQKFTLIGILKERRSYDKYLKKGFKEYTGEYALCKEEQLDKEYNNIEKYRFVMDHDRKLTDYYDGTHYTKIKVYDFYILDRKENKKYYLGVTTLRFYETIVNYVIAVDKARSK